METIKQRLNKQKRTIVCNLGTFTSYLELHRYMKLNGVDRVDGVNRIYTINNLKQLILSTAPDHTIPTPEHKTHGLVRYIKCDDCSQWYDPDSVDFFSTIDGNNICENCIQDYIFCEECGGYCNDVDVTEVYFISGHRRDSKYICDNCLRNGDYVQCEVTDEYWLKTDCTDIGGHSYYKWVNNLDLYDNYFNCEDCGDWFSLDDCFSTDSGCYCESCYNARQDDDDDDEIHNYNYKPAPVFNGAGEYYFGLELEIKYNELSDLSDNLPDVFYLKHDGSLSDSSCEIVSHPCTLDYWKNNIDYDFLNYCSGWHDGYGIHVHISRTAFDSQYQIEKLVNFFAKNPDFIECIAQRRSDQWAKIQSKIKKSDKKTRYQAVNQCNSSTIEIRIFQSSTKLERILKNFEFCDACIQFVKLPYLISEQTEVNFVNFVFDNKDKYNNLFEYINLEKKPIKK